jgi:Redoxin
MTAIAVADSVAPAALPLGAVGPTFDGLLATDGHRYGLADVAGRAATILLFSSNRCPTAKAYDGRLAALVEQYQERGVGVIAMNSNDPHLYPDESYERMVERASAGGYTFPYVVDAGQAVARSCGATCTFHAFLFDGEHRLRYQGRFDDSRFPERVTSDDLLGALEDVLAGREVVRPTTTPFGCSLDYV